MSRTGEIGKVTWMLDALGIEYEDSFGVVKFSVDGCECVVFDSTEQEGRLVVGHSSRTYVDSATEALKACGVIE